MASDFATTIIGLRNGAVVAELGDRLRDVVRAVKESEKNGALTLTLKVSPAARGKGGADVVVIEADVKTKIPQPDLGKSMFFTDDEYNLLRSDPRQLNIQLEERSK